MILRLYYFILVVYLRQSVNRIPVASLGHQGTLVLHSRPLSTTNRYMSINRLGGKSGSGEFSCPKCGTSIQGSPSVLCKCHCVDF